MIIRSYIFTQRRQIEDVALDVSADLTCDELRRVRLKDFESQEPLSPIEREEAECRLTEDFLAYHRPLFV